MTTIIGINGFKRSGKGETAAAIERLVCADFNVRSVGFADKLKVLAAKSLGFVGLSDEDCIDLMDEAKEDWFIDGWSYYPGTEDHRIEFDVTGRQYLQHMGTQARNVFGADFWVDQVLPNTAQYDAEDKSDRYGELVDAMYPGVNILCFTDVRFENEAQRIRDLGGYIVEVLRPDADSDGHDSEQVLPTHLIDYQIVNDKSLDELEWQVRDFLTTIPVLG